MRPTIEQKRLIDKAQVEIASILKALEIETQMVVQTIRVHSIDIRTLNDSRPEYQQCVQIEMHRLPGHNW